MTESFGELLAQESAIASTQGLIEWEMQQRGVTRKELAQRMGISQPEVSILLGLEPRISIKTLARVMHALGADLKITTSTRQDYLSRLTKIGHNSDD